jgi:hypothetical protein
MNMRLQYIALSLGLAIASMAAALEPVTPDPNATPLTAVPSIKAAAAREAGIKAVIYGVPLVLMDITMQRAIGMPHNGVATPINQFGHMRMFPTAAFKEVVRANVDTLYSSAFLDLSSGPQVLSVPDTHDRYYLMPLMDAWTNVFATPGKRTTGTRAGNFLITGPDWTGANPAGMQQFKSPTNMVWILGRTQTDGLEDYAVVHAIQDGYKLTPLASWGQAYVPPRGSVDPTLDRKTPPVEQLRKMTAADYFDRLARLLKSNPPPAAEAPILAKLAMIGIKPGERFDAATLDPEIAKGLDGSVAAAIEKLEQAAKQTGHAVNGWRVPAMILGNYGDNYAARAMIALIAFGANLPADAVYPTTFVDAEGNPLDGAHRYILRFDPDKTPPVNAFWSITMYDPQSFFVDNPLGRYAISSWMPLTRNKDGSIDIFMQHDSPGKNQLANWLPVPSDGFNVTLRMYWPKSEDPSILDGSWKPPGVIRQP